MESLDELRSEQTASKIGQIPHYIVLGLDMFCELDNWIFTFQMIRKHSLLLPLSGDNLGLNIPVSTCIQDTNEQIKLIKVPDDQYSLWTNLYDTSKVLCLQGLANC